MFARLRWSRMEDVRQLLEDDSTRNQGSAGYYTSVGFFSRKTRNHWKTVLEQVAARHGVIIRYCFNKLENRARREDV